MPMEYVELIKIAQHMNKEVNNDLLHSLAGLEKKVLASKNQVLASPDLTSAYKNALCDVLDDVADYISNVSCEKTTLNRCVLSCLRALHAGDPVPEIHQIISLVSEAKLVVDKLRIARGLELVIKGCTQPVKRETRRISRKLLKDQTDKSE